MTSDGESGLGRTAETGDHFASAGQTPLIAAMDDWYSCLVRRHELAEEMAEELRVCLHELIGNAILYGGLAEDQLRISITAAVTVEDVTLVVEDNARPFNPLALPVESLATSLEDARIGGLGLRLVRSFTDHLAYDFDRGGNRMTLRRCLPTPPSPSPRPGASL